MKRPFLLVVAALFVCTINLVFLFANLVHVLFPTFETHPWYASFGLLLALAILDATCIAVCSFKAMGLVAKTYAELDLKEKRRTDKYLKRVISRIYESLKKRDDDLGKIARILA